MDGMNPVQLIAVVALPLLFAITLHEVAHGWIARQLGDPTAMMLGRLTVNPIKHIDPIGTVVVPLLLLLSSGFVFGWAKPVPVTWENLKNPKRDMALVAAAGPGANLVMALFWAIVLKLGHGLAGAIPAYVQPLLLMGQYGIFINLVLMVLNLLPVPPLDGSRIVSAFLPGPWAYQYSRLENYGLIILLLLLVTGALSWLILPPVLSLKGIIDSIFGL